MRKRIYHPILETGWICFIVLIISGFLLVGTFGIAMMILLATI